MGARSEACEPDEVVVVDVILRKQKNLDEKTPRSGKPVLTNA
jgi:hypothetical protein